ncbi:WD40 repeat-containing protein [Tieghemostelium lacteum]|uniref:tRNA (guanine-N(7)-)-methyltransferase non-catalytic subunit n=1 Tax=Tieghemostelium lacteum TaxID=361077 RepID=A0A151ZDK8_TIELA|nr:WD40 repeat-containing protein [Tieghemostelium lacteum]|eukprot:KYQ91974.1 WD40 repeat-containing protein [Tieghemostelium lacteum]
MGGRKGRGGKAKKNSPGYKDTSPNQITLKKIPLNLLATNNNGSLLAFAMNNLLYVLALESKQFLTIDATQQHQLILSSIEFQKDNTLITTSHDRHIKIWEINNELTSIKLVKSFNTNKKIIYTALSDKDEILVADKCGDVLQYSLVDDSKNHIVDLTVNKQSKQDLREQDKNLILGHYSSITDIRFSRDFKYLLTSDRDEKIRVSNYPNAYDIEVFCLASEKYVTKLLMPLNKPSLMISGSGDGHLYLWNWLEGKVLQKLDLNSLSKDATVIPQHYNSNTNLLAVSIENFNIIQFYQLSENQLTLSQSLTLPVGSQPISIDLVGKDQYLVSLVTMETTDPFVLSINTTNWQVETDSAIVQLINNLSIPTFTDSTIFKTYLHTIEKKQYRKYISGTDERKQRKDGDDKMVEDDLIEDDDIEEDLDPENRPSKQIKLDTNI